ncbi:MAG: Mut7-C RNAse domain-containing protein [Flavisolibacter sp.]
MRDMFIADVHLGKLARLLRLLGFDTLYRNDFTKSELARISREEDRILLSRDREFAKYATRYFIVSSEDPMLQLKEVVAHFNLKELLLPFSRCIACNGTLEKVSQESVAHLLQKTTREYYSEFWQCADCRRVYWKGSHYERMLKTVEYVNKLET